MEITFDNVYCGYKAGTAVLRGVSLHLSGPGLVCIIGPNGVGKSTLIRCMNGLLKPSSGSVAVNGKDIGEYSANDLSEFIGYVPVTSQDCFSMPVFDTVLMGRYRRNKWRTGPEDIDATERTLKLLGLSDLAMHGFNELSAGQHQKVALARGLVREPEMLILDEPTSNLDVRHQVYVTELLHEIAVQCGMMVVMISHDLNISARYADKIIVMDRPGTIKAIGDANDVITEEMIAEVYGVDCEIIRRKGRPHVILGSAIGGCANPRSVRPRQPRRTGVIFLAPVRCSQTACLRRFVVSGFLVNAYKTIGSRCRMRLRQRTLR